MGRTFFYATKADIIQVLRAVDARVPLKFVPSWECKPGGPPVYASWEDIPDLGICSTGDSLEEIGKRGLLAMPRDCPVVIATRTLRNGEIMYTVELEDNPKAIQFNPCGLHEGRLLIQGYFENLLYAAPDSKRLFGIFQRAVRKHFRFENGVWLGTEAWALFEGGMRLTDSAGAPPQIGRAHV